jgi:hypothetical protein
MAGCSIDGQGGGGVGWQEGDTGAGSHGKLLSRGTPPLFCTLKLFLQHQYGQSFRLERREQHGDWMAGVWLMVWSMGQPRRVSSLGTRRSGGCNKSLPPLCGPEGKSLEDRASNIVALEGPRKRFLRGGEEDQQEGLWVTWG